MQHANILEKIKLLFSQIDKNAMNDLENEFRKFNPTEKTWFNFSCGYNYHEDKLYVSFNIRATFVKKDKVSEFNLFDFFKLVIEKCTTTPEAFNNISEALDLHLANPEKAGLKIYPALHLNDKEESIAFMFYVIKPYYEA